MFRKKVLTEKSFDRKFLARTGHVGGTDVGRTDAVTLH